MSRHCKRLLQPVPVEPMSYCLHGTGSAVGIVPTVYADRVEGRLYSASTGRGSSRRRPKLVSSIDIMRRATLEEPTASSRDSSGDGARYGIAPYVRRRSHTGTLCVAPPRYVMDPRLLVRAMNSMSTVGRTSRMTYCVGSRRAVRARCCGSMTPPFAKGSCSAPS